ncbi:MAG: hypothetical protein FWD89_01810 [Firmicutes bacterium]|nr:hypothetical protein [Bacillota bacterium]MCL2771026.1 hypothetical protein [Bacillota bacterium]
MFDFVTSQYFVDLFTDLLAFVLQVHIVAAILFAILGASLAIMAKPIVARLRNIEKSEIKFYDTKVWTLNIVALCFVAAGFVLVALDYFFII